MPEEFDAAIVGGGIAGLANAWMAARSGRSVVLFERDPQAKGASTRNFGMVWLIGQPLGEPYELARRSREFWLEFGGGSESWMRKCGSLHLAHHDDEWAVLQEFAAHASKAGIDVQLCSPEETLTRSPAANPDGLRGALWSEAEVAINPRAAMNDLSSWLGAEHGVTVRTDSTVVGLDGHKLTLEDGSQCEAGRIVVCAGSDIQTLYPEVLSRPELQLCKLQMMRTRPQPDDWRLGPLLAGGLTMHRYESFSVCPSQASLRQRISAEHTEIDQFGIHTMASQFPDGSVVLGDSHEYGSPLPSSDSPQINELILREERRMIHLPRWEIAERWHGIYLKHTKAPYLLEAPADHVRIMTGLGGAGMTLSFGLAEKLWQEWGGGE